MMKRDLLLAHLAGTWMMVGVIWFVQLVHYPLFDRVERAGFRAFAIAHQEQTFWVVFPPMLIELITGIALLWWRPRDIPLSLIIAGALLIGVNALSTALMQIPLHEQLGSRGYDVDAHRQLVAGNWVRTIAWSLRGFLVLFMLRKC